MRPKVSVLMAAINAAATIASALRSVQRQSMSDCLQSLVDTRDFGLTQCQADWIATFDADDCMHKQRQSYSSNGLSK